MRSFMLLNAICLSILASTTSALGINCRGSFQCVFLTDDPAQSVVNFITGGIDQSRTFSDGELIACSGFICAFLQGTGGMNGAAVLALAPQITGHGCNQCGSVPTGFPATNDVLMGQLTINAVGGCNPCANGDDGLCPPNTGGGDGGNGIVCAA